MWTGNKILIQVGVSALLVVVVLAVFYMLLDVQQLQFIDRLNRYPGIERYNVVLSGTVSALDNRFIEITEGDSKMSLVTNESTLFAATEHNWDVLAPVQYDSTKVLVGNKVRVIGFIEKGVIVTDMVIRLDSQ